VSVQEAHGIVYARSGIGSLLSYVQNLASKVRTVKVGDIIASSDFNAKKQLLFELVKASLKIYLTCHALVTPWDIRMISIPTPGADYDFLVADVWCWKFINVKNAYGVINYGYLTDCRVGNKYTVNPDYTFSIAFEDLPYGSKQILDVLTNLTPISGDWNDLIVTLKDYWAEIYLFKATDGWHVNATFYENYNCSSEAGFHNLGYRLLKEEEIKSLQITEPCPASFANIGNKIACIDGTYALLLCDNQTGMMSTTVSFEINDPDSARPYLDLLNKIESLPNVNRGDPVNSDDWNKLDELIRTAFPLVERAIECLLWLKVSNWFPIITGSSLRVDSFTRSRSYPNGNLQDSFFSSVPKPKTFPISSESIQCRYR